MHSFLMIFNTIGEKYTVWSDFSQKNGVKTDSGETNSYKNNFDVTPKNMGAHRFK